MKIETKEIRKALSIKQPWAWAILQLGKDVENRTWSTNFRGFFLIHASKTLDKKGYEYLEWVISQHPTKNNIHKLPQPKEFKVGGIVGFAEIIDCSLRKQSSWHNEGAYGFYLRNQTSIPFMPMKGKLGFFYADRGIVIPK